MKIEVETIFLAIIIIVLPYFILTTLTPSSDQYLHYVTGREIIKNPSKLIHGEGFMFNKRSKLMEDIPYYYPPLTQIGYGIFMSIGLAPHVFDVVLVVIIGILLWEINKKAFPFMFLSFMFVRLLVWGCNDTLLLAFILASFYFYDKKPIISGIFAGLCPLVKGTGFIYLGSFVLSILLLKRKEIFNRGFYKNPIFLSIIIALLVTSPWYIRNYILFEGDIFAAITGQPLSVMAGFEEILKTGIQAKQPERSFIDMSGFYPIPVDFLIVSGVAFFIFNIIKKREISFGRIIILVYLSIFIVVQVFQINYFMSWRYYIPMFPFLAIEISKAISDKYMLYVYGVCFIILIAWLYILIPAYVWPSVIEKQVDSLCIDLKPLVGFDPVYIKSYTDWYVIYRCDLNSTSFNNSKWAVLVDFTENATVDAYWASTEELIEANWTEVNITGG